MSLFGRRNLEEIKTRSHPTSWRRSLIFLFSRSQWRIQSRVQELFVSGCMLNTFTAQQNSVLNSDMNAVSLSHEQPLQEKFSESLYFFSYTRKMTMRTKLKPVVSVKIQNCKLEFLTQCKLSHSKLLGNNFLCNNFGAR